jgi:NADP-dependent 3-hydroxy acid dehydrogenase YdfG
LRAEFKPQAIRVAAIFPADFEHVDPVPDNVREPTVGDKMTSQQVVDAVMFVIIAPRNCTIRAIILEGTV